jgi:hypothetical protein
VELFLSAWPVQSVSAMSEETQIQDALPDRPLVVEEAESLVESGDEHSVLPSAILVGESGDNDVVSIVVETADTAYALGFDPDREAWIGFETWERDEAFDRSETDGRVREWVKAHHEGAADDEIWNPSA